MKWSLPEFDGKDIVFIGRGREGISFERFIGLHGNTASFRFVDRSDGPDYLTSLSALDLTKTVVVKTPGCPGSTVPVPYTTATNVFLNCVHQLGARLVGITGTKGKSTTTSMIGAILKEDGFDAMVCGNIGIPMLDVLGLEDPAPNAQTVFVVELSSYQLSDVSMSPDIAVVTNLYEDHIPYHGSLEAYWDAKRNIIRDMRDSGTAIYNPQFDLVAHWVRDSPCRGIPIDPDHFVEMSGWKVWGDHNRLNALLAITAAGVLGVSEETALNVLRDFDPLPHRLQHAGTIKGVEFIDNAIGGNPAATIAAMSAVRGAGKTISCLIVGGVDRNINFCELGQTISGHGIPFLVLLPETGKKIRDALPSGYRVSCHETSTIQDAVAWAVEKCPAGTVCLLSPASSSQTISKDFEELGCMFTDAVKNG